MILTDREIKIALSKGQFAIDPAPPDDAYSSTAVDLTLDDTVRRFKKTVSGGAEPVARGIGLSLP